MITGLLRNKLDYNGLVISDDMQMAAITEHFSPHEAITLALNAGVDLLVFGNQLVDEPVRAGEIVDLIYDAVNAGHISIQRIDEAYERIQKAKNGMIKGLP